MPSVTLSNLQIDENPIRIGGNPNVISMSVDIIINTNDINDQQFFYEVKNSENEIIAMQIHPQDHKIKPNTKVTIRIPQVFRTADGNYRLNAWSVSTWTGRRFDWGSHTGIKEWNPSSNVASISEKVSRIGTGFQRGQAYQAPAEPAVVSGVKPFEKPERVSVFQPKKTLSPQIKKIIDDWSVKKIIVPAWFANNNMNWVLEGRITETEFLNAYTNLVNTGAITFTTPQVTLAPIPEITIPSIPEVSAVMELITTNFQVKLNNKIQFSSSLSNADYKRLQDEMSLEPKITLVFLNQTDFNPLSNFSKILRQIQNLLQKQVVETITITPEGQVITAPEPTVVTGKPGLMGMGVLGVIGILMLGGFIADHVRKRK